MRAHKLIVDLEEQNDQISIYGKNKFSEIVLKAQAAILLSIKAAPKFLLPGMRQMGFIIQGLEGDAAKGDYDDLIKAPFPSTYYEFPFDYEGDRKGQSALHRAALVTDFGEKCFRVASFIYMASPYSTWQFLPTICYVSIEKPLYKIKNLREAFLNSTENYGGRAVKLLNKFKKDKSYEVAIDITGKMPKDIYKEASSDSLLTASLCIYTMILLNVKNLSTKTIYPSKLVNKKRAKNKKLPLFSYKVLNIKLPGSQVRGSNTVAAQTEINRLHFCRGHFKRFTEKRPLLGRAVGLYWWNPQIRGNKKRGAVLKDYAIN